MFDHLIMPPRAGYAVITTNDFMVIVRDTGDIVSVLEDADAVLEHLSLTILAGCVASESMSSPHQAHQIFTR
ncbi:hypothetical protein HSBAA_PA_2640 (plasmid) [Vreelandella sulfidaeris]|uniref:Uncharacterized protein n=1 Tax=Vreelandella sulfidaeris TaxID=115553 RepID=A0A455ULX4_9GAMM|nr:hypothetical protein HSBAA_PA_2640 [Halomonas sulfidaeris]